jgi:SAM-dependent methyltransferase
VTADLGSGTGISAEYFLRHGNTVYGVEPNDPMREAAEDLLARFDRFHSVSGSAEATTLPDASVDLVVAAQAFHWFDIDVTRREVRRILRPDGHAAIIWNMRRVDTTPFLRAYEALLLRHGTDYAKVRDATVSDGALARFFGGPFETGIFPNKQTFDFDGLRGRLLSASYVPGEDDPRHVPMIDELRRLFDEHHEGGRVRIDYETLVYCGRMA